LTADQCWALFALILKVRKIARAPAAMISDNLAAFAKI